MDSELVVLVSRNAWPAVAALVIAALARAAKSPAIGSPFARVPVHHRAKVVLALGAASGVLDAVVRGTSWPTALVLGLLSAAIAIAGHGAVGGVNPQPKPLAPGQIRVTAPPGATVSVEAVLEGNAPPPAMSEERSAPARGVNVEPSQAWGPAPSGSGS